MVELTNGAKIPANTLIWTAGTAPNPLIAALPVPKRNGRIVVNDYLGVDGWPGVWAVGDCALVSNSRSGGFYPPTALAPLEILGVLGQRLYRRLLSVELHLQRQHVF